MSEESDLLLLVAALLRGDPLPPELARRISPRRARRHHLTGMAYRAGVAELRNDFRENAFRAELQRQLLEEVGDALAGEDIAWAPLKGAAYAWDLYEDPALRPMSDLDILVRTEAFERAGAILHRLGFRDLHVHSRARHARTLTRRPSELVDLHRAILQPLRRHSNLDDLWQRAMPSSRHPGMLRFGWLDLAFLHVAHIVRHEYVVPLVSYIDAARLRARLSKPETDDLSHRLTRVDLGFGYRVLLGLLEDLRQCGSPGTGARRPLREQLARPSFEEIVRGGHRSRNRQLVRKLLLSPGDAPRLLLGHLLIARDEHQVAVSE